MKKHDRSDHQGGPHRPVEVSAATVEDLAFALADLAEAERLRSRAVAGLARVRARGDGEAAVGMPVDQHLRWNTNVRRGTVTTIGVITDVAGELTGMTTALDAGTITLDQAAAIAWPAARVGQDLRRQLNVALDTEPDWTDWSPETLEVEVTRMLEDLTPSRTEQQEREAAEQQWLHLEPTLDGQGLRGNFQAHGLDAALINATLDKASDRPQPTESDPDGILVGRTTKRAGQLFDGLIKIFRSFGSAGETSDTPDVTIYAIVDETTDAPGSGELLTTRAGLAPRLSPAAVRRLEAEGARRIEVFAIDRELVAIKGRAGHTLTEPQGLSEDTTRIIVTIRDRTCRMPGCDRPVEHLHHLIHQGQPGSTDDPGNLAGLCLACHQQVHRWRWSGTVGTVARITWTRASPTSRTTTSTRGRLATRLRPPRPDLNQIHLDQHGDPLPF